MDNAKRNEWLQLIAQHPEGIDPILVFLKNARRKDSAFHDDFEWSEKAAAQRYYQKRAAQLVVQYSTQFNTITADQRLHLVVPMKLKEKGIERKIAKTADSIAQNPEELAQVRAAIWKRLRRLTRDMFDFRDHLPEFKEIQDFLLPIAQESVASLETSKR